jgi:hypothetical protein
MLTMRRTPLCCTLKTWFSTPTMAERIRVGHERDV